MGIVHHDAFQRLLRQIQVIDGEGIEHIALLIFVDALVGHIVADLEIEFRYTRPGRTGDQDIRVEAVENGLAALLDDGIDGRYKLAYLSLDVLQSYQIVQAVRLLMSLLPFGHGSVHNSRRLRCCGSMRIRSDSLRL